MRLLSVSMSVLGLALSMGCAQTRSTSAMGAGPAQGTPSAPSVMCRDGAWKATTAECGSHGGVERALASPSQR